MHEAFPPAPSCVDSRTGAGDRFLPPIGAKISSKRLGNLKAKIEASMEGAKR